MNESSEELEQIIIQASNENTSPECLTSIYQTYSQNEIKIALANNPNTPFNILIKLAKDFPTQFLANSVFDLYLLSNPNLLTQIPRTTILILLKNPLVPKIIILFVLNNQELLASDYYGGVDILVHIISNHTQVWNEWQQKNFERRVDFGKADLKGVNFKNVNLTKGHFYQANLQNANLTKANLELIVRLNF